MEMPRHTAEIFERLARGQFLSANTQDLRRAELYRVLSEYEELFTEYFSHLGLTLAKGPGYYYFTREEVRSTLEDRLERTLRWLDWLDWLVKYAPRISPGTRLVLPEMVEAIKQSAALRRDLKKLPLKGSLNSEEEYILALLRSMEREGLAEQVSEKPVTYRILASIDYVIQLLSRIQPLN